MEKLGQFLQEVSSEYVAKYDHSNERKDYPILAYGYNYMYYWLSNNTYSIENLKGLVNNHYIHDQVFIHIEEYIKMKFIPSHIRELFNTNTVSHNQKNIFLSGKLWDEYELETPLKNPFPFLSYVYIATAKNTITNSNSRDEVQYKIPQVKLVIESFFGEIPFNYPIQYNSIISYWAKNLLISDINRFHLRDIKGVKKVTLSRFEIFVKLEENYSIEEFLMDNRLKIRANMLEVNRIIFQSLPKGDVFIIAID